MWSLIQECWYHEPCHRPNATQIVKRLNPWTSESRRRGDHEDILIRQFMSSGKLAERSGPSSAETLLALEHIVKEMTSLTQADSGKSRTRVTISATSEKENAHPETGRELAEHRSTQGLPPDQRRRLNPNVDEHIRDMTGRVDKITGIDLSLALDAGSRTKTHGAEFAEIVAKLKSIFEDIDLYRQVLNCNRSKPQSQGLLDLFQQVRFIHTSNWKVSYCACPVTPKSRPRSPVQA
jgi:hypothetical protein